MRIARALGIVGAARIAVLAGLVGFTSASAEAPAEAHRVISLNPSITSIVVALGAGGSLVGVDDFSARQEPAVAGLPRVGGLYDPSLEAVVALSPDLVALVPSAQQRDFRARLSAAGIPTLEVDPTTFEEVLVSIETVGRRVGKADAAALRVAEIRRARSEVEAAARRHSRPSAVLVLQRDPLFVVGEGSFIDEMLSAAGARNLAAGLGGPYPRAGVEWLVASRPEVILDAASDPEPAASYWKRWPSLPAVGAGRVVAIDPALVTLPGPRLDGALRALAAAIHGDPPPAHGVGGERR